MRSDLAELRRANHAVKLLAGGTISYDVKKPILKRGTQTHRGFAQRVRQDEKMS